MDFEIKEINIRDLRVNDGEVAGLPRNPRKISVEQLEKLKKSMTDAPEMLRLRELIVIPHGDYYLVIAGNMRLEAAKAVGMEALPCKILPMDTPPAKLREYAIKDNLSFGQDDWDALANEWEEEELSGWGMEIAFLSSNIDLDGFFDEDEGKKDKGTVTIQVILPAELKDKEEDVRRNIELTLAEYRNIKIK